DALLLAQTGDHSYSEIGAMLKEPAGTVKWRVSEARRQVRLQLAERGYADAGGRGGPFRGRGDGARWAVAQGPFGRRGAPRAGAGHRPRSHAAAPRQGGAAWSLR